MSVSIVFVFALKSWSTHAEAEFQSMQECKQHAASMQIFAMIRGEEVLVSECAEREAPAEPPLPGSVILYNHVGDGMEEALFISENLDCHTQRRFLVLTGDFFGEPIDNSICLVPLNEK